MSARLRGMMPAVDSFAAVGELLHSLVPPAQSFCYFDLTPACIWSDTGSDDFEVELCVTTLSLDELAGSRSAPQLLKRSLPSGRTSWLLFVRDEAQTRIGILVIVFAQGSEGSDFTAIACDDLQEALVPAAQILGESLLLKKQLREEQARAGEAEQELKLVYQVDEKIRGTLQSHSGLSELVGKSGRFLGVAYALLLLPSKRIRISATHSSWKSVDRKVLDGYLTNSVLPRMQGEKAPLVFEKPAVPGSGSVVDAGYQTMVCPIVNVMGNVEGILALLGRVNGEPFRLSHTRLMAHIARKVEYVVSQSFDVMTGLINRAGFEAQLRESMQTLAEEEDSHQIIYFDLDNLQLINDTFGHEAGDKVIKRFAEILSASLPKSAVASRLTGDDFAILLTHSTLHDALELTTAIRESCQALRYLRGDKSLQLTVSMGVSAYHRGTAEGDALTAARIACDSAKDHGRDRVEVYDQDDQSIVRRYDDMHLVAEIQKTVDGAGFQLVAQPIVSLLGKTPITRYEILLRMKGSDGGTISSKSLFSAAERYQLMPQIDRWVISSTIRSLAKHRSVLQGASVSFAINLSGQSLGDDTLLTFVMGEIDASGLPPEVLCFEVTESAAVSNHRKAQAFIDALRERGCKFSLDDFGVGLSSFAYLKTFNVDTLKIDGSFIKDITENRISESMVAAITQVAKVMHLETVAEYVETQEIRSFVARLGVNYAQGHAVGKPAPLEAVLDGLHELCAAVPQTRA